MMVLSTEARRLAIHVLGTLRRVKPLRRRKPRTYNLLPELGILSLNQLLGIRDLSRKSFTMNFKSSDVTGNPSYIPII